jgi:hypothetical protein
MPGIVALGCLFALYWVTMFILWYWTQPYRIPPIPRRDEPFVLLEGQTILGVIQKRNKLYFCVADVKNIKDYE